MTASVKRKRRTGRGRVCYDSHMRSAQAKLRGLYVIIDPAVAAGRDEIKIARQAIEGGAGLIQWRDKSREKGVQLPVAEALRRLCREAGAMFLVNDDVDL